jgi:hypothetical protein
MAFADAAALGVILGGIGLAVYVAPTAIATLAVCGGSFLIGLLACGAGAGAMLGTLLRFNRPRPRQGMDYGMTAAILIVGTLSALSTGIPGTIAVFRNYPNNIGALWEILGGTMPVCAGVSAAIFAVLSYL